MLCPDEERLVDYIEGRLSKEDRSHIEEHLSDCEICLEGLMVTRSILHGRDEIETEPVPAAVTESAVSLITGPRAPLFDVSIDRLKLAINRIKSGFEDLFWPDSWMRWQPAAIRGAKSVASEDLFRIRVSFKKIKTEIEVEKTANEKALIRVQFPRGTQKAQKIRVTLKENDREIASYLLEGASVRFEAVPFGHYGISLTENGVNLGTYLFEIKETGHGGK